jgi:hypothetical protein
MFITLNGVAAAQKRKSQKAKFKIYSEVVSLLLPLKPNLLRYLAYGIASNVNRFPARPMNMLSTKNTINIESAVVL